MKFTNGNIIDETNDSQNRIAHNMKMGFLGIGVGCIGATDSTILILYNIIIYNRI